MIKSDHQDHAPNRFDFNTLSLCGAKTRAGGSCKHKGNIRNGRCKLHGGKSTGPKNLLVALTTLATSTDCEPRKQSPYASKRPTCGKH